MAGLAVDLVDPGPKVLATFGDRTAQRGCEAWATD
jgi:hypothetical protein